MSELHPSWPEFREQFPVTRKWAYFDNAAVSPISGPAMEAVSQWSRQSVEEGDMVWPQWARGVEETRKTAANLIGADEDEVAFIPNTTYGIGLVAEGLPWRQGDNVVILDNEFPTNVYPWLNLAERGVETRRVPTVSGAVSLDDLASAIDAQTRLVSVSWVGYASGWRIDVGEVAELVHSRGALVLLDAIQGMGVFPLDVRSTGIDFAAADGHKWMLSPEGAGMFFMRREHLDLLRPIGVGWNSVVQSYNYASHDYNLKDKASRYEGGSHNMVGLLAFGASLGLLAEYGLSPTASPIAERVLEISDLACAQLTEAGARILSDRTGERRSGIVAFEVPGQPPEEVRARCRDAGVVLSCRNGHLRISPHAFADEADVARLVEVVANCPAS